MQDIPSFSLYTGGNSWSLNSGIVDGSFKFTSLPSNFVTYFYTESAGSFETNNPSEIPKEYTVSIDKVGPGVTKGVFGGQGSGAQTFLVFNWKAGITYKFLVKARPLPQQNKNGLLWKSVTWKQSYSAVYGQDDAGDKNYRRDVEGGVYNSTMYFMRNGGFFNNKTSTIGDVYTSTKNKLPPKIEFATLP